MGAGVLTLSLLFGTVVGFALGLTGGGGGVFAVPMLVYGLSVAPRDAVGISLAAVGGTALLGVLPRLRSGQVELGTGLWFALAGMVGAPLGSWTAGQIPEALLLVLFAVLMFVVAVRMWRGASRVTEIGRIAADDSAAIGCRRDGEGQLRMTSGCAFLLAMLGLACGFLSGLFGVGGGFVIVPSLVLVGGMPMHRAVGTSLLAVVLISATGVVSHGLAGRAFAWEITGLFLVGGMLGVTLGTWFGRRLSGARLQKVFAATIVGVAILVVGKTMT
jgi:uncharacterized membrane protein YfcA